MTSTVPAIGHKAPEFTADALVGEDFKQIKLSDYKGKYVVLFTYPLDWTFVCPTEIIAFDAAAPEFEKIDTVVIGLSIDNRYSHYAWNQAPRKEGGLGGVKIPLIADLSRDISNTYGAMMLGEGHTVRATYVIDREGVLRHISFNDPPVGRSVDEVLRLVKGYQFVDKNGEVCPAGWIDGGATIKTEPTTKLEFFGKQ